MRNERQNSERREQSGGNDAHRFERYPVRRQLADQDHRYIGDQHPERRSRDHCDQIVEPRGQHYGCDLRLVPDLGQEERNDGHHESAEMAVRHRSIVVDLVRLERPQRDDHERKREQPAKVDGGHDIAYPGSGQAGKRMVEKRGHRDAKDDRHRLAQARCEHQREKLGLIADFTERDDDRRYQKRFHEGLWVRSGRPLVGPRATFAVQRGLIQQCEACGC
jgi:hypothetical protein